MVRLLFALLLVFSAAPAFAEKTAELPVDQKARAQFPLEDGKQIDLVSFINAFVNHSMKYESDETHYGKSDHWVASPPDMKGDCEDYALTKLELLEETGFPILSNARVRMVLVTPINGGGKQFGHAILEIKMPKGSIIEMDLATDRLVTRGQLEQYGYQFFDW